MKSGELLKIAIISILVILIGVGVLFFSYHNYKPKCFVEGDHLYTGNKILNLEANFTQKHNCTEITFKSDSNKDFDFTPLKVNNFVNIPSYVVDENGKFIRWFLKENKTDLVIIPPHISKFEVKNFYLIYGNDRNVIIVFISKPGEFEYTYQILKGGKFHVENSFTNKT